MKNYSMIGLMLLQCFGCGVKEVSTVGEHIPVSATEEAQTEKAHEGDYLGAIAKADKYARGTIEMAPIRQAIVSFQTLEGRFPRDLAELVSKEFLAQAPVPPDGRKFLYDSEKGQISMIPASTSP